MSSLTMTFSALSVTYRTLLEWIDVRKIPTPVQWRKEKQKATQKAKDVWGVLADMN